MKRSSIGLGVPMRPTKFIFHSIQLSVESFEYSVTTSAIYFAHSDSISITPVVSAAFPF